MNTLTELPFTISSLSSQGTFVTKVTIVLVEMPALQQGYSRGIVRNIIDLEKNLPILSCSRTEAGVIGQELGVTSPGYLVYRTQGLITPLSSLQPRCICGTRIMMICLPWKMSAGLLKLSPTR